MSNPWFRMYAGVINDPKVMKLPEATRWQWVAFLCVASDNDGKIPPAADLAFSLRMTEQRAASLVVELHRAGLLDKVEGGGFEPHNWGGRQYQSDSSTKRVQKHRNKKRNESETFQGGSDETFQGSFGDVTVTPPEQSRTETEQSRAEQTAPAPVQIDLVEKVLRSDLLEIFGNADVDLSRAGAWLAKGYDPGMIREVVRDLRARKPGIASLAYFEPALAERHAKRAETPSERRETESRVDFDKVVAMFARGQVWSRYAGPEPGQPGCRAPLEILVKHGLDAKGQKIRKAG